MIYKKLNDARIKFHKLSLRKTGHNKFSDYHYFELADFLIPAIQVFDLEGLCAVISFTKETATMTIYDVEKPQDQIVITSPMGTANLKGCHEVQNIGAVETYQRRYLWMSALEIVEHDALDRVEFDEYAVYESAHLQILREAALDGLDALQKAFNQLPAHPMKSKFWATHQKSLKEAASGTKN